MFVVYEIISQDRHLPVNRFRYRDEAEGFIVEECCVDGSNAFRYYVEFSKEIQDHETKG